MPRYRTPPMDMADLLREGPPIRLRDLRAMTGLSSIKLRLEIQAGEIAAVQTVQKPNAPYFIPRHEARRWLCKIGFLKATA